jgi:hypothetical protein
MNDSAATALETTRTLFITILPADNSTEIASFTVAPGGWVDASSGMVYGDDRVTPEDFLKKNSVKLQ